MNRIIIFSLSALFLFVGYRKISNKKTLQPIQLSDNQNFVLLELFTSQGCSSCPSADKLLEKTVLEAQKSGKKVFALSYHVDYWDRLGWKDPYSQAQFTKRQYDYADWLNTPNVYTPQIIANGQEEFVGSDSKKLNATIDKIQQGETKVSFDFKNIEWKKNEVNLEINLSDLPKNTELNVALVSKTTENYIPKGENEGLKLRGANVVRVLQKVSSSALQNKISLLVPKDVEKQSIQIIAFIQDKQTHKVLGIGAFGN
jgi:hypothetical protein